MQSKTQGYDHLVSDMTSYPELVIFRKFKVLNYRALLFLQAELTQKEGRLLSAIRADRDSGDPERQRFAFSFDAMLQSMSDTEDDLLLQNRKLEDLPPVHKPSLECLREAQMSARGREFFLRGRELHTWSKRKEYDLTSLTDQKEDRYPLSLWLEWCITKVFHKHYGQQRYHPVCVDEDWAPAVPTKLVQYPRRHISRAVTTVTTILAPILPTLSASALFFIKNERTRLGFLVMLSFLFSVALACVGVPRRIDSFVATATFTAVLIVFINSGTTCTC